MKVAYRELETAVYQDGTESLKTAPIAWRADGIQPIRGYRRPRDKQREESKAARIQTIYPSEAVDIIMYGIPEWDFSENGPMVGFRAPVTSDVEQMRADRLPVEFFNHQLMECDAADPDALASFVSAWGLPFHPSRFDPEYKAGKAWPAIRETEALKDQEPNSRSTSGGAWLAITAAEARATVELLQGVVLQIREYVRGAADDIPDLGAVNAGACSLWRAVYLGQIDKENAYSTRGLTNAICNQIMEAIADTQTPWVECKSGCGAVFKQKQPADPAKHPRKRPSEFCSEKCKNRQGQRDKREKRKQARG